MTSDMTNGGCMPGPEGLLAWANRIHKLVISHNSVRERFRQQCKLFYDQRQSWWQTNSAYEVALKPYDEKVTSLTFEHVQRVARMQQLAKQHLQTSPEYRRLERAEKRYVEKKAKAEEELREAEAKLQPPGPCPDKWLQMPDAIRQTRNEQTVMEYMFPDDDPPISKEVMRLRAHVVLAILHDYALKNEVYPIADDEVWPQGNDAIPEPLAPTPWESMKDFALSVWKNMEANPSWWCGAIDRALRIVEADGALEHFGLKQPSPTVSIWEDIPMEYRDAIEQYRARAKTAKKEHKRVYISKFCIGGQINESLFRGYLKQVQMREKRQASWN